MKYILYAIMACLVVFTLVLVSSFVLEAAHRYDSEQCAGLLLTAACPNHPAIAYP